MSTPSRGKWNHLKKLFVSYLKQQFPTYKIDVINFETDFKCCKNA